MSRFEPIQITEKTVEGLKSWLSAQDDVFPFSHDDESSLLICYILSLEIGGPNDDLAQFIYDEDEKRKVDRKVLETQVGLIDGKYFVRIRSKNSRRLSITIPDSNTVASCHGDEILIAPSLIASSIEAQNLTPVFVKKWVLNEVFSDFDPKTQPLYDQLWVLRNNDAFLYSHLVASHQVVFQGMHDIVWHIRGLSSEGFGFAVRSAEKILEKLRFYFGQAGRGNMPSHLLPFLVGVLLDDLTQKRFYFSQERATAIEELLSSMDDLKIDPKAELLLRGFPKRLNEILQMVRDRSRFSVAGLRADIQDLTQECRSLSMAANG